jgi:hypothetical protein
VKKHSKTTLSGSESQSNYEKQQFLDTQFGEVDYLASFTNPNPGSLFSGTSAAEDSFSTLLDYQLFGSFLSNVDNIGNNMVYHNAGTQFLEDLTLTDIELGGYYER